MQAGTIDGYDYPSPADWESLKGSGYNVLVRPVFNILYVGINQKNNPALQDIRVRQAIWPTRSTASRWCATSSPRAPWWPPSSCRRRWPGYASDIQPIPYDPERAKALLAEAGQSNLTVNFYYPTEVTRPYMPNPTNIFTAMPGEPAPGGDHGERGAAAVERRLPRLRQRQRQCMTCTCSGGPATTTTPATSSARSSAATKPEFGFNDPACSSELAAADATCRPGGARRGVPAGQPGPHGEVPAGHPAQQLAARHRRTGERHGPDPVAVDRRAVLHGQQGLTPPTPGGAADDVGATRVPMRRRR